jgi:hypothetical protein
MLGDAQFETVVSSAGIRLYMFDSAGEAVSLANVRGTVGLRVEGNPKRYRYDLLPDGNANLTAPVNLSKIAGKQIELEMQIVGLPKPYEQRLKLDEVITLPASREQQIAAEISRQKICPVSGKPLGSMGQPVAVEIAEQTSTPAAVVVWQPSKQIQKNTRWPSLRLPLPMSLKQTRNWLPSKRFVPSWMSHWAAWASR